MKFNRRISYIIIVMLLLVPLDSFASGPIGKRIVLDNGMILLLSERHEIPMVTINMAIKAGSVAEPEDKPGLASLTAALMMQGTTKRTANQISGEIDFIGGSLSVSGGSDFAGAALRVLKKDIEKGLDLLSDVLMHPVFDQKEIDRKVKETLAGIQRQKEEPGTIAAEAFAKAVFGGHPYGRTSDDVAAYLPKVSRQDVVNFHAERYGPGNSIIAVVGDVTEKEIISLLTKYLKDWKQVEARQRQSSPMPRPEKTRAIPLNKDITQANVVMGHVGISRENPDFYAVTVMNYILGGGGFTARLMDNIRDNRGLAYDVHSSFSAQKEQGSFSVEIQTKNESANEVISETIKEITRMKSVAVSEKELADAKAYLTGSFPLRMDTYAKIAGILTNIEIYNLGLDYPEKYPMLINSVAKDDVLRVAAKYLDPDHMVIVVVANQEKAKLKY